MNNQPIIQSLNTGIKLIEIIVNANKPLKFSDIQQLTKMTKSNLHKYLNTLTINGILFRDNSGYYYLGSKLIEFGNAAIGHIDLIDLAGSYLKNISEQTGLTTLLSVWSTNEPVIAHISRSNLAINIGATIGTKLPPLSSAGKIYMAFAEALQIEEWKKEGLKHLNQGELNKLETNLSHIRKVKFSYAAEPLVDHISSFSLPILNFEKKLVGVITVVGFHEQIPKNIDNNIVKIAMKEAFELAKAFGFKKDII